MVGAQPRPDGAGGYTGTLFFTAVDTPDVTQCVSQEVAVHPDGDHWLVEALGMLERRPLEDAPPFRGNEARPVLTYTAEAAGLRLEIGLQYSLGTGYARDAEDSPQPHIHFTEYDYSMGRPGLRAWHRPGDPSGRCRGLALNSAGDRGGCGTAFPLPNELGGGGGTAGPSGRGVGLDCVAALALTFTYNGHTYTCTADPAEVTP